VARDRRSVSRPAQHEQDDEGGTNEAALTKQQAEAPSRPKELRERRSDHADTFNTTSFKLIALVSDRFLRV